YFVEQSELESGLLGNGTEGFHVLGEARSSVSDPRLQEPTSDAGVGADSLTDLCNVSTHSFAKVGDCVDERDLRREKGIGCVINQLGAFRAGHDQERRFVPGNSIAPVSHTMQLVILTHAQR